MYQQLIHDVQQNDAGHLVFDGRFYSAATSDYSARVWSWTNGGGFRDIARGADHAPGTDPGVQFRSFEVPSNNDVDDVVFLADLVGGGIDTTNDRGVWAEQTGILRLIAREGAEGPGPVVGNGIMFDLAGDDSVRPWSSQDGTVVFRATSNWQRN
jgi:hypothetical protein